MSDQLLLGITAVFVALFFLSNLFLTAPTGEKFANKHVRIKVPVGLVIALGTVLSIVASSLFINNWLLWLGLAINTVVNFPIPLKGRNQIPEWSHHATLLAELAIILYLISAY